MPSACYLSQIPSWRTRLTFEAVGWLAVVLTQVFYIPNTLRILRTRDVRGYSLLGWLLLFLGLACYLVYFASRGDPVGIVANAFGVFGAGFTAFCIWLWRGRDFAPEPGNSPVPAVPGQ
ncbi:MAG: hypothetical protein DYG91_07230 [Chloroflexi bacterium CFX7]|nr:hypothetical protein [Chloroflexi bacterium CFX7]RIL02506.1 MAG: hypothetical protein DCC78_07505 [bacterium]